MAQMTGGSWPDPYVEARVFIWFPPDSCRQQCLHLILTTGIEGTGYREKDFPMYL